MAAQETMPINYAYNGNPDDKMQKGTYNIKDTTTEKKESKMQKIFLIISCVGCLVMLAALIVMAVIYLQMIKDVQEQMEKIKKEVKPATTPTPEVEADEDLNFILRHYVYAGYGYGQNKDNKLDDRCFKDMKITLRQCLLQCHHYKMNNNSNVNAINYLHAGQRCCCELNTLKSITDSSFYHFMMYPSDLTNKGNETTDVLTQKLVMEKSSGKKGNSTAFHLP